MDFEIVSTEECHQAGQENSSSDLSGTNRQEMYKKLETDLVNQIKMCQANRLYFKSTGDVASANKFHQMEEHTKKDLDSLRFAFRRGDPVPKFHYEVRSFSKVVICSDLTDNELEFAVVQGINLNVAKDAHTYCR
jgi:coiled-coil and C2 domain-containing protein 1